MSYHYEKMLEVKQKLVHFINVNVLFSSLQASFFETHLREIFRQNIIMRWKRSLNEGKVVGTIMLTLEEHLMLYK